MGYGHSGVGLTDMAPLREEQCECRRSVLVPLPLEDEPATSETDEVIATIELEANLAASQRQDKELALIIRYLETGILPDEEWIARIIALSAL